MSISCPRCATPMAATVHPAPATGARIEVDVCNGCRGLWLDSSEIAEAFKGVGQEVGKMRALLAGGARHAASVEACPRCSSAMVNLAYFDMDLDLCSACHGLWVDGDEIEALARGVDRKQGLPAPEPAAPRPRALETIGGESVACAACGKQVARKHTLITAEGTMCNACGERANAPASVEGSDIDDPEVALMRSTGRRNAIVGVMSFVARVGVVLGAVLSAGRCSRCGCSHHSHCHH